MKRRVLLGNLWLLGVMAGSMPAFADDANHPAKAVVAQPASGQAAGMMPMMQDDMKKMQEQMNTIKQTKDPKEREKLMQELMKSMEEHMKMMKGMMGDGKMMEHKDKPH